MVSVDTCSEGGGWNFGDDLRSGLDPEEHYKKEQQFGPDPTLPADPAASREVGREHYCDAHQGDSSGRQLPEAAEKVLQPASVSLSPG